jgi:nucleoside 2-deoxyribosyltransferase
MAFGRKDTDRVYRKLIAPTLRRLSITPVRVDRIEHLEDINNKIIAELNKCDVALADLTYARPSVYFEAGYAQRKVPVVYTCRQDHLSGRADDQFGNYRVHFDLRMKNIIPWSTQNDAEFRRKLGRRIKRAVLPLFHERMMKNTQEASARKFAAFSIEERLKRVVTMSQSVLRHTSYAPPRLIFYERHRRGDFDYLVDRLARRLNTVLPGLVMTRQTSGEIRAMLLHVTPSLTQSLLKFLASNLFPQPIYSVNPRGKPRLLVEHLIVCSLRRVPISLVQNSLPYFHFSPDSNEFVWDSTLVSLPSKRIRGYDELYSSDYAGPTFLGLNSYGQRRFDGKDRYLVSRQVASALRLNQRTHITKEVRVARVLLVKRHIHLRIFGDVKFEKSFQEEFRAWLRETEKCV